PAGLLQQFLAGLVALEDDDLRHGRRTIAAGAARGLGARRGPLTAAPRRAALRSPPATARRAPARPTAPRAPRSRASRARRSPRPAPPRPPAAHPDPPPPRTPASSSSCAPTWASSRGCPPAARRRTPS